ncbi:MAG: hypothetical protein HOP33_19060 [Verrucomicrobia bacterium]|nr:hypothetical protein [Verrucomicrobiota bacterium]
MRCFLKLVLPVVLRCGLACAIVTTAAVSRAQSPTNLNLQLVSKTRPSANPLSYGDVWAENNLACLGVWLGYSTYNYGVGIFTITNPAAPVLLSVYSPGPTSQNQFELGAVRNQIGYFGSWSSGGLHVVSLTNPASPVLLTRISSSSGNGFDRVHTIFLERDFLYEAAHVAGTVTVKVFSVTNPVTPVYLRDIVTTNTTKVHQMTVRNKGAQTLLFTSGWGGNDNGNPASSGQTDIWDVTAIGSQPAAWLGRVYSGYNSHSSWPTPDGNTLIVCRETPGGEVKFYDISNPAAIPTNPVPFVTLAPASMGLEDDIPHNPVVVSNFLFVSWYQNGIQVFDISDRTRPVRVGFFDTFPGAKTSSYQGNWGVFPNLGFDKLLLSDIQSGMFILDGTGLLTPTNNYPPLIVQSPSNLSTTQGLAAAFAPVITGSQLQFQWRFNGTNLPGATGGDLTLMNVQANQAGSYSVLASNASGVVTSAAAVLSIVVPNGAPIIGSQPQNVSVYEGNAASFSVAVVGAAPLNYQWHFNGGVINNATNSSYALDAVQPEQVGFYSVVVSNALGTATSSNALLTLQDSPYLSNVRATPGIRSALISWSTTVPSSSQVQFDVAPVAILGASALASGGQSSFSANSVFDPALVTNHVVLITGLSPDTRYSFQTLAVAGTNTYVSGVYQFATPGTNVMDNPSATFTGSWTEGTSSTDKFSTNYQFATSVSGAATATATWRPNIVTPGKYDVYVWYPQGSNRATDAPYLVSYNGGSTNVLVNQQSGSGAWRLIAGGVEFAKGTNGFVRLSNNAGPSVVLADAVRFVYVEAQDFPTGAAVPQWWRDFFFGGAVDVSLDPDGDNYPTAQEYVLGTSPVDSNSRLAFWNESTGSNAVGVTFWPLHADRSYQLQSRSDLAGGVWQTLADSATPTVPDGRGRFDVAISNAPQSYFRLKAQMMTNGAAPGLMFLPGKFLAVPFAVEEACGPVRVYVR